MTTNLVGRRIGEFAVTRELGRGGMGVVYEAVQTSLGRRVALKVLGPGLGFTPTAVDRFRREAAAAARLRHPHIVPVYATGEDGGVHFYAMELVDGPSLDAVIRRARAGNASAAAAVEPELSPTLVATGEYVPAGPGTPSPSAGSSSGGSASPPGRFDQVARRVADVAEALHHAHQGGVTHRDVKPSNLILAADGRLRVTDFGLARVLDEPGVTVTGEFVGTPAYMSPEQITAGRIPVDHRTDVYSLGATLYELLTLRPPFAAEGRDKLLALVVQKEPPRPRAVDPAVPRDLETICLKCLEKDPDRRYATARELADDLRRYVDRFAIRARRSGPSARLGKWVRRNPALAAAGLAALVAVGAAGFLAWEVHAAEHRRVLELEAREREEMAEERQQAVERAMTAVFDVDVAGVGRAVAEAEAVGAAVGETELLRGWVESMNGRAAAAIPHLERAAERLPGRAAPRGLLALAYFDVSDRSTENRWLAEVQAMPAVGLLDKLYKAVAIAYHSPAESVAMLEAATAERRTPLGLSLLCIGRQGLYLHTGAIEDCDAAVAAAELYRQLTPGSIQPVLECCGTRLLAAVGHGQAGDHVREAEHQAAARRHADDLARFGSDPRAVSMRTNVSYLLGGLDTELDLISEVSAARAVHPSNPYLVSTEAYHWLCLGNDHEAEVIAAELPGHPYTAVLQILAALGRPGGRTVAIQAYDDLEGSGSSLSARLHNVALIYPLDRIRAVREATALIRESDRRSFPLAVEIRPCLEYLAGTLSEADLLANSPPGPLDRFFRQYFIAWKHLGDGDRPGARGAFEAAYQLKMVPYWSWFLARAMLIRMADPTWPRAIPMH